MDAIHFKVRQDNQIVSKAGYVVLAVNKNVFKEGFEATVPHSEMQRCIIHQIRNTLKYVPYKDRKLFATDLKTIYSAIAE